MGWAAVCSDPAVAALLAGPAVAVVLYGLDATELGHTVADLRRAGGRVAALIGDPADHEVEAAALALAAELFGRDPVLVRSRSDAGQFLARPPGQESS